MKREGNGADASHERRRQGRSKYETQTILSWLCIALGAAVLSFAPVSDALAVKGKGKTCSTDYVPVCAVKRDGTRETFSNACNAGLARARILHAGSCFIGEICLPMVATRLRDKKS